MNKNYRYFAGVLCLLLGGITQADTLYSYQGNPYNRINNYTSDTSYHFTSAMRVTAWITTSTPLPANYFDDPLAAGLVTDFSISDGINTFTYDDIVNSGEFELSVFGINTDADGEIIFWFIEFETSPSSPSIVRHYFETQTIGWLTDTSRIYECDVLPDCNTQITYSRAETFEDPGVWTINPTPNAESYAVLPIENPSEQPESSRLGNSVAVTDTHLLVGALSDSASGVSSGRAFLFDAVTGRLLHTFDNPAPGADDQFGFKVALSADKAVVGAPNDDTTSADNGRAYVFDVASGNLLLTIDNPSSTQLDQFGYGIDIDGDKIVIGTRSSSGRAYVFDATTGALLQQLNAPGGNDLYGSTVSIDSGRILVGASGEAQAHLFDANTYAYLHTFVNPNPPGTDAFGGAVDLSGNRVLIGAYNDDTGATDTGRAYLYDATTYALVHSFDNPTPSNADRLTWSSVGISGDKVLVAAFWDDTLAQDAGSAYLFDAVSGNLILTLDNPAPDNNDYFGVAVDISPNKLAVGAYFDDAVANNSGRAYLYSLDGDSDAMADDWEDLYALDKTNALDAAQDPDGDLLVNADEYLSMTVPTDPDTDADGLNDGTEVLTEGTDPIDPDSDNDWIKDGFEVNLVGTDPLNWDTDGDSMDDFWEASFWVGPLDANSGSQNPDGDLFDNLQEYLNGTNPRSFDSGLPDDADSDGISNYYENTYGLNWLDPSDALRDLDGDGLSNLAEFNNSTYANNPDSDWDGMPDGFEVQNGLDPKNQDADQDADGDGLNNGGEYSATTDPNNPDSDGDWIQDGFEVNVIGTSPLNTDTDGDTMDDFWESTYWVGPLDPNSDGYNPDGDAYVNIEEYQNGTNPNVFDP